MKLDEKNLKSFLEGLYYVYARRKLINPDPLYFLYDYEIYNREIVGLIASSLAYGRVNQIMKSVKFILKYLTGDPKKFLLSNANFNIIPESFKHRFTAAYDINNLLKNISEVLKKYNSIENFMCECISIKNNNLLEALNIFSDELSKNKREKSFNLISAPRDNSACKRLFLYLKWLVRSDEVDPGGWKIIKPAQLIVPTDTHMYNIAKKLGFTSRKSADLKTALEITEGFKKICPDDPAKYDFVLTRFGIRAGLNFDSL